MHSSGGAKVAVDSVSLVVVSVRASGLRIIRASKGNRIEGTPTPRGTFTFNLTVRDPDGQQATQVTSITIN